VPGQAQVGRRRKQIPAHLGAAAPVVRVADGAVVGEVGASLGEDVASGRLRVAQVAGRLRNADPPQFARDRFLEARRRDPRRDPTPEHERRGTRGSESEEDQHADQDGEGPQGAAPEGRRFSG